MIAPLTDVQLRVARRVLAEEGRARRHLVVTLSGSHAYGFPSPDSDLDLKAIHADPTERVLGLGRAGEAGNRLEVIDGVEIDYTSNEVAGVLSGVLAGNGNYVERILGPLVLEATPAHASLRAVVARSLSRRLFGHYAGFGRGQLAEARRGPAPTAKRVLYVLRTALTGLHLMRTGELVVDLRPLLAPYGFAAAAELIAAKRAGERVALSPGEAGRWLAEAERALGLLHDAAERSPLPAAADPGELDSWLVEFRVAALG